MTGYKTAAVKADCIDGFLCTMGHCEDNCCRNTTWSIYVDGDTYEKYKKIGGGLGRHILNCIENDGGIYKFKKFSHGHCPILTDDGLCLIHRDFGEEYLGSMCKTYPRASAVFDGKTEHWLSLSCPDVVRWVLYRNPRINYVQYETVADQIHPVSDTNRMNLFEKEKGRAREMLVKILHSREFSLKEKLNRMCVFMRGLDGYPTDGANSPDYIELGPGDRAEMFVNFARIAEMSSRIPEVLPQNIKNAEHYKRIAAFHEDIKDKKIRGYITDAFDRLIVPYVNENRYVFENYLVYSLVSSGFLRGSDAFSDAYAHYLGIFLVNLVFAAGIFYKNEKLSHDDMTAAIYLLHRNMSHNASLKNELAGVLSGKWLPFMLGTLGGIE